MFDARAKRCGNVAQAEPKSVMCEHRSAAYFRYVSTDAQHIALCRPAWAAFAHLLQWGASVARCPPYRWNPLLLPGAARTALSSLVN